jgi:UDP-N-acetylmuramoyl-L-alanyl-D-glutamate--2,6-diaminopimelate ligase
LLLSELTGEANDEMTVVSLAEAVEVTGLTADSRKVGPGYLFAALPGTQSDGREFIDEAVSKGAVVVLAPKGTALKSYGHPVALVEDDNPRRRLAILAARFYNAQPELVAAVTGTNGKTSVADFTRQIWRHAGLKAASLGTLGLIPDHEAAPSSLTTPDPVELHACLAALAEDGVERLAMEASSHGLDQFRLDGVRVAAAAFTNLSRDHLDYHGEMDSYFNAKRRLFAELVESKGTAVLNADDPAHLELEEVARARGLRVMTYGWGGRNLVLRELEPTPEGLAMTFDLCGNRCEASLPLAGAFQAHNVLAALGLAIATDCDKDAAVGALAGLRGVAGRMEHVGRTPLGGDVYVDYAHTPDALATALKAARPHARKRLVVVFGCGGDRDPGKRPQMGAIASELADEAIVTDDNPRGEEPAAIRQEILAAAPGASEVGDRGEAIARAVVGLREGDVLVIAGKGHEPGQIVAGRVLPFDDRQVARAALEVLAEDAG